MAEILRDVSLKLYNTFGINVEAAYFSEVNSDDDLTGLLKSSIFMENKHLVLGGGSNVLFRGNFNGLIIKMNTKGVTTVSEDEEHILIKAAAGELWDDLVKYCIDRNYGGIENLSMIPGCAGAAPVQNIGAYGVELKDVFHSLEAIRVNDLTPTTFMANDCEFGYRNSVFKNNLKGRYIILSITLQLRKAPVTHTSYAILNEELASMQIDKATIKDISEAVCNIRRRKLPDPLILGNAGSFFKNPVVSKEKFKAINDHYNNVPSFPVDEYHVKIPAGWLIEKCGWKGKRLGDAGVHCEQALVLVNYGNATAHDIMEIAGEITHDIAEKFGIFIEKEVNVI